jgi:uncharacterized membrane protein SpoIIM required for sporulation
MQETEFIGQNKEKWTEFEDILHRKDKDPVRITHLFIETTDDLSYSRTRYANRSVRVYLNGIAQQVFQTVYKNKTKTPGSFGRFWKQELPDAMWFARKSLLLSFLLFMFGVSIGVLSSIYYPDFAKIMLGSGYVEMTEANISEGDPMKVYKDSEPLRMFLRIALNNIYISFLTFVLGIFFGVGTVLIILQNSIMVGAFIYFFIERGLFKESFLAIMLHGTLELSMIVMAGCAGFALSKGLIFPGTYTRGQALVFSARNGVRIMIGVSVLLVYAAFIESFATRYTDLPNIENGKLIIDLIRALVILVSFTLVLGYFVWYPWYRNKNGLTKPPANEEKASLQGMDIPITEIKTSGRIFTETFILFGKTFRKTLTHSIILSTIAVIVFSLCIGGNFRVLYNYNYEIWQEMRSIYSSLWSWSSLSIVTNFRHFYPMAIIIVLCCFSLLLCARLAFKFILPHRNIPPITYRLLFSTIIISTLLGLSLKLSVWAIFTSIAIMPFLLLWFFTGYFEQSGLVASLKRTVYLLKGSWGKMMGLFVLIVTMQWIFLFLTNEDVIEYAVDFIQMNIPSTIDISKYTAEILSVFIAYLMMCLFFPLTIFSNIILYFTLVETTDAPHLKESLSKIGFKKRAYGLETEK